MRKREGISRREKKEHERTFENVLTLTFNKGCEKNM